MSQGPPPPPFYGSPPQPPPPGGFTYVPAPVMMPMYPPPMPEPTPAPPPPTYVTNYIYQQPPPPTATEPQPEPVHVVEELIDWVPSTCTTASTLTPRAFVGGREGWDGSPLWIIRAHHNGEFVPGKLAIRHRSAYIPQSGKEVPVHTFEVLCAPAHALRWISAFNGQVPVGAIIAGNTHKAEPLYVARVKHERSITPGKVHPSHGCCYISFSGNEISYRHYEVLCQI